MGNNASATEGAAELSGVRTASTLEKEDSAALSLLADLPTPLLSMVLCRVLDVVTLTRLESVSRALYWISRGKPMNSMIANPWHSLALKMGCPDANTRDEFLQSPAIDRFHWGERMRQYAKVLSLRSRLRADGATSMNKAGSWTSSWKAGLFRIQGLKKPVRIVMLGLDAAGKTTIVYKIKMGEVVTTIPTIGFNVETLTLKTTDITIWDVGGPDKIRPLWRHYFQDVVAVIWVVDSNDHCRKEESGVELRKVMTDVPTNILLVFANKQDLPNAAPVAQVADRLGLADLAGVTSHVQASCATSGDGLIEGFFWLHNTIRERLIM